MVIEARAYRCIGYRVYQICGLHRADNIAQWNKDENLCFDAHGTLARLVRYLIILRSTNEVFLDRAHQDESNGTTKIVVMQNNAEKKSL